MEGAEAAGPPLRQPRVDTREHARGGHAVRRREHEHTRAFHLPVPKSGRRGIPRHRQAGGRSGKRRLDWSHAGCDAADAQVDHSLYSPHSTRGRHHYCGSSMKGSTLDLGDLLRDLEIKPVLMDVGASAGPPPIWAGISSQSLYIGFDPDLREIHEDKVAGFHRSVILNEAVTAERQSAEISFYLTRSPFCSTTLDPNPKATGPWLERDLV